MSIKQKKYHYIYKTTNNLSGRYYYGMHSTDNLDDGYLGSGSQLRRAINKHGKENFTIEIIKFCKDRDELKSKEKELVTIQEIAKKECMNLRVGGGGMDYKPPISDETRKKMSEAQKKRPINWDAIEKATQKWTGSHHTEESKKKISESNIGKTHTDEMKQHFSHVMYERWKDPNERAKFIASAKKRLSNRRGVSLSDETKNKISQSKKGKKITPQKRITCPHCGKDGATSQMKRYHLDNCKLIQK